LIGEAYLDFDASNDDKEIPECYMDAHGLLFELHDDLQIILGEKYSHVAIGLAFNKEQVKIVELYFRKSIVVHQIEATEDEGIMIQGQMLRNAEKKYDVGVYAIRIVSPKNLKKDIVITGPSGIQFDQNTKKFTAKFKGPLDVLYSEDEKILELYVRKITPPIPYGEPSEERINVKVLSIGCRMPMVLHPDPRVILEDEADKEREEKKKEEVKRMEEEEKLFKEAQKLEHKEEMKQRMELIKTEKKDDEKSIADSSVVSGKSKKKRESSKERKSSRLGASEMSKDDEKSSDGPSMSKDHKSKMSDSDDEEEESESEGSESGTDDQKEKDDTIEEHADLPSPDEMKRDLIEAIEQAIEEREQLKNKNQDLQKEIITMDSTYEQYDKQPDVSMNEHKYLNTLANVHQVRFNLKETQERYNKMATELQAKLNEKQAKCDEIQKQFKDLKMSVGKNSVYSRTGKQIKDDILNDWDDREATKDSEVHHFRFQNIALRNRLANKEKVLKKKEQLADGLHLIDFEQLKIENQTLNEKVEERNEELHKLQKKITFTVITLSHTEEKLKKNTKLYMDHEAIKKKLNGQKDKLSKVKEEREQFRKDSQRLRQQTGIENDDSLKADYINRKKEIEALTKEIELLQEHHQKLLLSFKAHNAHNARGVGI